MKNLVKIVFIVFVTSSAFATDLSVKDNYFLINNRPTYLFGISYYGAIGAPRNFIEKDLDDMQRYGINWIRVWATWNAFGQNVSAVDTLGYTVKDNMQKLYWLLNECDRRGIVVDITLTTSEGKRSSATLHSFEAHKKAVATVVSELKVFKNWYLDLSNEHNVKRKYISYKQAAELRNIAKRIAPDLLVTLSFVKDIPKEDFEKLLLRTKVDFISPHRPRNSYSPEETAEVTRQYLKWMKEIGRVVPVNYQEPFRRNYKSRWEPVPSDFVIDLKEAIEGGAAGWCYHNGDNQVSPPGNFPRRSFDMRNQRLFDQFDRKDIRILKKLNRVISKK